MRTSVEETKVGSIESSAVATDRLTFAIHVISSRVSQLGQALFKPHRINHFAARILVLLYKRGEMRIGELVDDLVLSQSTISSQLQIMERKGLVTRRRLASDSRVVCIALTTKGQPLARACDDLSLRVNQEMLDALGDPQRSEIFRSLLQINERLAQMQSAPPAGASGHSAVSTRRRLTGQSPSQRVHKPPRPRTVGGSPAR
jgi:DNA-binding MarR family transcriptional regulator